MNVELELKLKLMGDICPIVNVYYKLQGMFHSLYPNEKIHENKELLIHLLQAFRGAVMKRGIIFRANLVTTVFCPEGTS